MSDVKLHLGDCLTVMKTFKDNQFDAVITDPQYGINITKKANNYGDSIHTSRKPTEHAWDAAPPTPDYFKEIMRVSKNQIIFGANYFWECFYSTQCYIIWDKRGDLPDVPFCDTEFAWTSYTEKPSKRYVILNHGFIRDSKEPKTGHPTQKPLLLMTSIINDFVPPGDHILDPFAGSGTTGVAAVQLGRKFTGIEISPEYYAIAEKQINEAQRENAFLEGKL